MITTEELNFQKAARQQRIAAEISAAKRERDFYLAQVEAAKAHAAITERREKASWWLMSQGCFAFTFLKASGGSRSPSVALAESARGGSE